MKRLALVFVFCLSLLLASTWLIMHPAGAATMSVTCRDNTTRTCSGQSCTGSDAIAGGTNGYCQCSGFGGHAPDVQQCDGGQ
jgi:hypothetical protein